MSRSIPKASFLVAACAALIHPSARAEVATDAQGPQGAHWQAQKLDFAYSGFTARYSCDGLQDQVRAILQHFGAKDAKVKATGCDYSAGQVRPENFSRMAWVHAEFSTLVPGPDANGASVPSQWARVQWTPSMPGLTDLGGCELVDEMRPVLEQGFSLRNVQYRTDCVPKQVTLGDYFVQADALQAAGQQAVAH